MAVLGHRHFAVWVVTPLTVGALGDPSAASHQTRSYNVIANNAIREREPLFALPSLKHARTFPRYDFFRGPLAFLRLGLLAMVRESANVNDRGYTNDFGMTSGAAPLVSGVVALMLQANPSLGWREVQDILIRTARRVNPADRGWRQNGGGLWFNHKYGAGLVDASAAVAGALAARRLGEATSVQQNRPSLGLAIPDNQPGGVEVRFDLGAEPNLRVEHVQFIITATHAYRGDLHYELVSPSGMVSTVAARPIDRGRRLVRWVFMSVQHWGEESRGVWTLRVSDRARRDVGFLEEAELVVHGVRIAES